MNSASERSRVLDADEASAVKARVAQLTGSDADEPEKDCRGKRWLHYQYHENGLSLDEIGAQCGVTAKTVANRMERLGIERRRQGPR